MKELMDRVAEVRTALTAVKVEFGGDPALGATFTLAMALADLVKNDPGACAASRDVATEVLDAVEAALVKVRDAAKKKPRLRVKTRATA